MVYCTRQKSPCKDFDFWMARVEHICYISDSYAHYIPVLFIPIECEPEVTTKVGLGHRLYIFRGKKKHILQSTNKSLQMPSKMFLSPNDFKIRVIDICFTPELSNKFPNRKLSINT